MKPYVSSKHLEGVSDLTLSAPIKRGFVDAFEAVTYETRLRLIMRALFNIRATAREHSIIKPFADTAERIQTLLDFRLAIRGPDLLLSATFDKPFEPYIRLIWDPLGPLLDVIFCNCEGYVTATENSFEDYLAWVRKSQIDTDFFYSSSNLSIEDIQYVTKLEKLQRESPEDFLPSAVTADDPTDLARKTRRDRRLKKITNQLGMEALVALYKLADFYPPDRPEGDGKYLLWASQQLLDGWNRKDLAKMGPMVMGPDGKLVPQGWQHLVEDQLAWIERQGPPIKQPRGERLQFDNGKIQGGIIKNKGAKAPPVRHGALLLMRIVDPVKARAFIRRLAPAEGEKPEAEIYVRPEPPEGEGLDGTFLNLAFTCNGLARIGLPQAEIDRLPQEFREGMEERAGLLGDVRENHPRRWALPPRNWPRAAEPGDRSPVQMSEIDIVIQLRTTEMHPDEGKPHENKPPVEYRVGDDEKHPLQKAILSLLGAVPENTGVQLLSVEAMHPARSDGSKKDHFGFRDGISQPNPVDGHVSRVDDEVPRGDIFLGYSNSRGDDPPPPSRLLDNGSFLVIRKLHQDVPGLEDFVRREAERVAKEYQDAGVEETKRIKFDEELLYAKMMGRDRMGNPLLPEDAAGNWEDEKDKYGNSLGPQRDEEAWIPHWDERGEKMSPATHEGFNRFTYELDREGTSCPFQAHIRRTNPRAERSDTNGRATPRILRRGLSYGPLISDQERQKYRNKSKKAKEQHSVERGVFFMAYNASIAEQFEVIQRWVIGGNSTGVASWQSDPIMGVGQHGDKRTFRFSHQGREFHINIPKPFVTVRWGAYLFVPSMDALRMIGRLLPDPLAERQAAELVLARKGEKIVARLLALAEQGPQGRIEAGAAWKTCLEDLGAKDPAEKDEAAAVWAAIRLYHGGAVRVPYGVAPPRETPADAVLVGSKDLVMRVFRDPNRNYSMSGQMARMKQSFGEIYLGMDEGPEYWAKSRINDSIYRITEQQAFELARGAVLATLASTVDRADALGVPEWKIDLRTHFITPALAIVCNHWFGIPDRLPPGDVKADNLVDPWGWSWAPAETRKPRCPGDYMATSRFCFYPDPIPRVQAYGKSHGQALRRTVRAHFEKYLPTGTAPGVLTRVMMGLRAENGVDRLYATPDELARNVIGVMTGFLPPADGCMRAALFDWIDEKTLASVQHDLISHASPNPFERASEALRPWLERAMQKRPAPDLLWRTATRGHRLGEVDVAPDDRVIVGIVSALGEDAAAGLTDVYPIFGGDRGAADAPLHACPASKAAMGTMLGILSALLDSFRIEPLPSPMLVKISDPRRPALDLIVALKVARLAVAVGALVKARDAAAGAGGAPASPSADAPKPLDGRGRVGPRTQ